ncbi:hypothetical protein E1286_27590 [Nonomuraea terrae]|uniref:Uncharacterized protein n=1 Tax=Nonomuraea terrae TaxID=2530383 RepID=A0A4R4YH59_9ACTN|nr:hypothetical protein [Nonomuraea terrae]TDD44198.1 hypothetical protein E1286_27590 [Nonomuraea terrae]
MPRKVLNQSTSMCVRTIPTPPHTLAPLEIVLVIVIFVFSGALVAAGHAMEEIVALVCAGGVIGYRLMRLGRNATTTALQR